jgi:hypothetical protein
VQAVLESHDAQTHRPVPSVGCFRLLHRVVVDVDDVVEHPHGDADGLLELLEIESLPGHVGYEVDRAEVADRDLVLRGVEGDLGAEVGAVHHSHVLLRAPEVARILEGNPRMPGLEEHRQHLAPQLHRRELLEELQLAARGFVLEAQIGVFEGLAELVVQLAHIGGAEQRPVGVLRHPFHEQVRDPVGRVHVVGAAPVVAGVLAKLEEFLDVEVPGL